MRRQEHELHRSGRAGWLRAAVLGADDGIASTASLMIGVAAASASREAVFLAGLAGLTAGVMSMAAGEYVSVSSHRDAERADIERESTELAHHPASELRELVDLYVQRGLDADLAQKVAKQLTAADALETHMREELGSMPGGRARPVQAAVVSALSRSWEEVMSEAVGQSAEEAAITARRRELLLSCAGLTTSWAAGRLRAIGSIGPRRMPPGERT